MTDDARPHSPAGWDLAAHSAHGYRPPVRHAQPDPPLVHPQPNHPQPIYPRPAVAGPRSASTGPAAEERRRAGAVTAVVAGGLALIVLLICGAIGLSRLIGDDDGSASQPVTAQPPITSSDVPAAPAPSDQAGTSESTDPAASAGVRVGLGVALAKGDCIQSIPKGQTLVKVTLVPCTVPHEAQVGSTFSPAGTVYPGGSALDAIAREECPVRLDKVISRDAPPLSWTAYYPAAVEWNGGDHSIKCVLRARDHQPLTRSVI